MSHELLGVLLYAAVLCAATGMGIVVGKRKLRRQDGGLDFADDFSFRKLKVLR